MHQYNINTLQNPNLPEYEVDSVIMSGLIPEAVSSLINSGIKVFQTKPETNIEDYLSLHADLQFFHYDKDIFYSSKEIRGELGKLISPKRIKELIRKEYPFDVYLNAVSIGDFLICNNKTISKDILEKAYTDNKTIIDVKQGYSKCSICIVDEKSIITDDESIYRSVSKYLDDVLLISKGSIFLPGQNYGFIGGTSGKLAKNKIAFCGRIESHSDHNGIIDMLSKHNIEIIELYNNKLTDIGSIIPISEKVPF